MDKPERKKYRHHRSTYAHVMSVKEIPEWRLSYLAFSYSYPYLVNPESLLGVRLLIAIKPLP